MDQSAQFCIIEMVLKGMGKNWDTAKASDDRNRFRRRDFFACNIVGAVISDIAVKCLRDAGDKTKRKELSGKVCPCPDLFSKGGCHLFIGNRNAVMFHPVDHGLVFFKAILPQRGKK